MKEVRLIKTEKRKPDYLLLHLNAFQRIAQKCVDAGIEAIEDASAADLKKLVNHGVRACVLMRLVDEQLQDKFLLFEGVKNFISALTPREMMQIFPVRKEYDGEKWQCKDYFYTMQRLTAHGLDTPIGEQIDNVLWDYTNITISMFMVGLMGVVSDLHKEQTGHGMLENFFREKDVPVYRMRTDPDTGKKFMFDAENGRTIGVRPVSPRHLKLLS